jgi:hypothetical protein
VLRRFKTIALLLAVGFVTTAAHQRLPHGLRTHQGDDYVPQPQFAKVMSLGFDAVHADYYWVQAVLLAGESQNPQAESTHLGRLIDVVTTLDPWVDHPYRFAAIWLTETLDDVRHGNMLLRRSFDYHPDEWRNRFYLGFNLFYYLDDNAAAADALQEASTMTGAPQYLPRLVARLRSESASLAAAGLFLEELVRTTEDEAAKAEYQSALDEVQIEWRARQLDDARENFKKLHGRDIEFVEQLVAGNDAVLDALPDPEPSSLPAPLRRGSKWELDEEGVIVSSYYGRRYEVHIDEHERTRKQAVEARTALKRQREAEEAAAREEEPAKGESTDGV